LMSWSQGLRPYSTHRPTGLRPDGLPNMLLLKTK